MTIEWNEFLMSTGSDKLDSEHKEWIQRFNEFDLAIVNHMGLNSIDKRLAHFVDFSNVHFPNEETLMERCNCPAAATNRAEHQKYREKLMQMQMLVSSANEANWKQLLQLEMDLENWLIDHICTVDVQLRPYLPAEKKLSVVSYHQTSNKTSVQTAPFYEKKARSILPTHFAELILQNSPDVIVVVDEKGRIVFVNDRCLPLLGFESKELLGQTIELLVPNQYTKHKEFRETFQQNPTIRPMSNRPILSVLHKSGAKIPVDISLSPIPEKDGKVRLIQAVIRDALPLWSSQYELLVQSVAMNAVANGIVITDINGIIQWINPAVTKMTGYSSSELIGNSQQILNSGLHEDEFYSKLWKTILAGDTWFGEIINRRKDGTLYYEEQTITPVRFEDGQIKRFVAIKQDVTARRQAELKAKEAREDLQKHLDEVSRLATLLREANKGLGEKVKARTKELENLNVALKNANQQLTELDDLKSSFLGVISHELRTPFASITFSMQLIEKYGLSGLQPEQQDLFSQLRSNVKSAEGMIENLINVATFFSKQGQLQLAPLNISDVISKALIPSLYKANHRHITLKQDIPTGLPMTQGDEKRLSEAVYQLLDNAIKFGTPGSTVTIYARLKKGFINIEVHNTGEVIPKEKLANLWNSFSQMADPYLRTQEGLGLGLALVDYIVRAHHGEVWGESQEGVGNTFGFSVPLHIF